DRARGTWSCDRRPGTGSRRRRTAEAASEPPRGDPSASNLPGCDLGALETESFGQPHDPVENGLPAEVVPGLVEARFLLLARCGVPRLHVVQPEEGVLSAVLEEQSARRCMRHEPDLVDRVHEREICVLLRLALRKFPPEEREATAGFQEEGRDPMLDAG